VSFLRHNLLTLICLLLAVGGAELFTFASPVGVSSSEWEITVEQTPLAAYQAVP
jgi:hypothetical protein